MNRKLIALLTASVLSLALLTGCGGEPSGDLLSQVKEKGELVIATEGTWAPWTYHN